MENLDTYRIGKIDIKFQRQGDLLYHEGPLLTHFINIENPQEHYFYKWSDCDDNFNRWAIFKISNDNLKLFFDGTISLFQLIQYNEFIYFVDINDEFEQKNVFICPCSKIPNDYLPSEQSFFKAKQYEKYALVLRKQLDEIPNGNDIMLEMILKEVQLLKQTQNKQTSLVNLIISDLKQQQELYSKRSTL